MQDLTKNQLKCNGRWTKEEHFKFLEGLRIYGKNWKKFQQLIQTRSGSQIRSHAQKTFEKQRERGSEAGQGSQHTGDSQDNPQGMYANSKIISQAGGQQESFSYFLTQIVDYSKRKSFDFWTALIDCKKNSTNSIKQAKKQSFLIFVSENVLSDKSNLMTYIEKN